MFIIITEIECRMQSRRGSLQTLLSNLAPCYLSNQISSQLIAGDTWFSVYFGIFNEAKNKETL